LYDWHKNLFGQWDLVFTISTNYSAQSRTASMTEPKYPRHNLYLETDVMDSLREIGDSNASRGVRVAVEYYERNNPKPWTLEPKTTDKWYQPEKKAKADVPFTFDGEK
jgi:hypothetical protein